MEGSALTARGLTKRYGLGAGQRPAVDGLQLDVEAGCILGLLGPNGAGKTTAIRMLSTVLRPDAGSFSVAGIPDTRPEQIRRRVGVLPESAGIPAGQTGREWLRYHARLYGLGRSTAASTADRLLAEVGLTDRADSLGSGYSRGMRQRLGIARALVNDPAVMFLDEPTLGLDPLGQHQVLELVRRTARGRGVTVVLSTHAMAEVERVCDRVLILNRGRLVADGTVTEVARLASAPRRVVLTVPQDRVLDAVGALRAGGAQVTEPEAGRPGRLDVRLAGGTDPAAPDEPVALATQALDRLLRAGIPVLEWSLDEGRLSEAFLTVTGPEPGPEPDPRPPAEARRSR
jgi:ABC-2 type transport system ATP-binding protein